MQRRKKIFIFLAIIIGLYSITVILHYQNFAISFFLPNTVELDALAGLRYTLYTNGCKVPSFDPFDPTVLKFYWKVSGDIPCRGKRYVTVENNSIVFNKAQIDRDFRDRSFSCTYKPILRNPQNTTTKADDIITYGVEKVLSSETTLEEEFIKVFCKADFENVYEDFLASTPIKKKVEQRCLKNSNASSVSPKLNIIVIGIDSVSKLNFERHFRLTSEYLRKNLSAFEFSGYMKVADNTFPNLTPMLTGHFVRHYYTPKNSKRYFDDLDFIWKNFSSIGYRTMLAEDAPDMGTYNYVKSGFFHPPTDYYFRPFTVAIEDTNWFKNSKSGCFQAVPEIQVLFNYLRSFVSTMEDRPFFAFTWNSRLTHNDLNKAGYVDKPAFELLRDIHDMGLLNSSILIFMSDHGIRFGGIRSTFIGKIEERMPFLFMTVPRWLLRKYPHIEANMQTNQKRLVTPFNLHETLVEVFQMMSEKSISRSSQYGTSLFRIIPSERTCESAFILPHWCPCHSFVSKPIDDAKVVESVQTLLTTVNYWTQPHRELCAVLELDAILSAQVSLPKEEVVKYSGLKRPGDENSVMYGKGVENAYYMVTIRVLPSEALLESTIRYVKNSFSVLDVSRINEYGTQGDCIDDFNLRKYCFCKK